QPVLVQYKPGANTMIGTDHVSKALPDGYTLLLTSSSFAVLPNLVARMPYKETDLEPVALISQSPMAIFVGPSFPANSVAELIQYGKTHPGRLSFGAPDANGAFVGYLFNQLAGTDMTFI